MATTETARAESMTWQSLGLPSLANIPSPSTVTGSDATTATVTRTVTTNGGTFGPEPGLNSYFFYYQSTVGTSTNPAMMSFDNGAYDPGDKVTVTIKFSRPVAGLAFKVLNIDSGFFKDAVEVYYDATGSGSFANITSNASISASRGASVLRVTDASVDGWVGNGTVAQSSTAGDLTLGFGTVQVSAVRIVYFSHTGSGDPSTQYIGLSNLTYSTATADLSLAKTTLTLAPYSGGRATWRLTLTNAASSTGTPASIIVRDTLPAGTSYHSASGSGSYNAGTGDWTVTALAPGASVTLDLTASVSASAGSVLTNRAEVRSSSLADPDSTPNNGATGEDDYASAAVTVASGAAFTCDSKIYLSQGTPSTQLYVSAANTNPLTFSPVGGATAYYNATAWNLADNFMYGIASSSATNTHLVRIASDGSVADLGAVSGLPAPWTGFYNAGVFIAPNILLVRAGNAASDFYAIDVSAAVPTAQVLSQPAGFTVNVTDFALDTTTGKVYGIGDQTLFAFTVGASSVSKVDVGSVGVPGFFGALFSDSTGALYGSNNNGGFYAIDKATGAVTLISSAPSSSDNDGSNCYSSTISFGADVSVTKSDGRSYFQPGGALTYTIVVSNAGPFGAAGVTVADPLPDAIPAGNVSYTASVAGGATTSVAGSGSGALADSVALPVGGSVTYTVTLTVPADRSAALTNTATVTVGTGTYDLDPANNSASDTDTQGAMLAIAKTASIDSDHLTSGAFALPGADLDYVVTVTNTGLGPVDGGSVFVVDRLPAEIAFYNGDADGSGSGTDPVLFTDNGSGVTFSYGANVAFSNGASPPASFAECTYSPAPGLDEAVRYLCVQPGGTFAGNAGAPPSFTLRFRTRIK